METWATLTVSLALVHCAGSRPASPEPQQATVISVRANIELREQQSATGARAGSSGSRANARPTTRVAADAGVAEARPPRTRCYADDERHPQDVVDLSSGRWHSCVVLRDRSVRCWGWNYDGQLGDGTRSGHNAPIVVTEVRDAVEVRAGWDFSCARTSSGAVQCWGENDYGQLGNGDRHTSASPVAVLGIRDARQITVGETHACALRAGGAVSCWGENEFGELGDGTTTLRTRPVAARFGRGVSELSAGDGGTCALHETGAVTCAGWLARGATPVVVRDLPTGVIDVALAKNFACANTVDDEPRCWGEGFVGQLGGENVASGEVFVPRPINGLRAVSQVALGRRGGCAVRRDGQLWCWGRVGAAARETRDSNEVIGRPPHHVRSLEGVVQVSVGDDFVCARMNAGGVCCFGEGSNGQLGHNRNTDASEEDPVPVRW